MIISYKHKKVTKKVFYIVNSMKTALYLLIMLQTEYILLLNGKNQIISVKSYRMVCLTFLCETDPSTVVLNIITLSNQTFQPTEYCKSVGKFKI